MEESTWRVAARGSMRKHLARGLWHGARMARSPWLIAYSKSAEIRARSASRLASNIWIICNDLLKVMNLLFFFAVRYLFPCYRLQATCHVTVSPAFPPWSCGSTEPSNEWSRNQALFGTYHRCVLHFQTTESYRSRCRAS